MRFIIPGARAIVALALLVVVIVGAWESKKPEKAARVNRFARVSFPLLLWLILVYAFRV